MFLLSPSEILNILVKVDLQSDCKNSTGQIRGHAYASPVHVNYLFCYRKAKSASSRLGAPCLIHPVKLVKDKGDILFRYNISEIDDPDLHRIILGLSRYAYYDPLPLGSLFYGITDKVFKDPGYKIAVSSYLQLIHIAAQLI